MERGGEDNDAGASEPSNNHRPTTCEEIAKSKLGIHSLGHDPIEFTNALQDIIPKSRGNEFGCDTYSAIVSLAQWCPPEQARQFLRSKLDIGCSRHLAKGLSAII